MRSRARCYDELREYCEQVPIVDCHDHSGECGPKYADSIQVVASGYFPSDQHSASCDADMAILKVRYDVPAAALEPGRDFGAAGLRSPTQAHGKHQATGGSSDE